MTLEELLKDERKIKYHRLDNGDSHQRSPAGTGNNGPRGMSKSGIHFFYDCHTHCLQQSTFSLRYNWSGCPANVDVDVEEEKVLGLVAARRRREHREVE